MVSPVGPDARPTVRATLARAFVLLAFWLLLAGPYLADGLATGGWSKLVPELLLGLGATATATLVSLRLLPPATGRLRPRGLIRLIAHFLWQSLVAGVDVALRAFDPRLPLKPGFLHYPARSTSEIGRAAFGAFTSLMPGTIPVGSDPEGTITYHCLDTDQPVTAALARDEALVARTRGKGRSG